MVFVSILLFGVLAFALILLSAAHFLWWAECRFQVHLSTLLLIGLLASGLIALNVNPKDAIGFRSIEGTHLHDGDLIGWPCKTLRPATWKRYYGSDYPDIEFFIVLAANLFFGLNLLSFAAMALEKFANRKVPPKGPP